MNPRARLANLSALAFGIAMTLILRGYQFGHSNHTIYLLDAMRVNDPRLLANDWFVTHTYQYHFVFTHVTAWLDRIGLVRPAFLVAYLALAVAWQAVWFLIVRARGGSRSVYVLSVLLFFLSAGGIGLGMYDFLQDSSFLPSNIANVAMLWGIYFWLVRRMDLSGLMLGVAGFFHLNHALIGMAMWPVLLPARKPKPDAAVQPIRGRTWGTLALFALCLPNIIPAARIALTGHHGLQLNNFVDLYVRLRHPHHYDPSSWPIALWVSFLWPIPFAMVAFRHQRIARIFYLLCLVVTVGLLFAGAWYISETLVQMSLARFSIYVKLLSCIAAATMLIRVPRHWAWIAVAAVLIALIPALRNRSVLDLLGRNAATLIALAVLLTGLAVWIEINRRSSTDRHRAFEMASVSALLLVLLITGLGHFGIRAVVLEDDPPDYLALCDYARDHTPVDAIFLVPPSEEQFRLRARRAIVVNFKGVPQFSSELVEWRNRLCIVLDATDLTFLPRRFDRTLKAIAQRYDELTPRHLREAASLYRARYIVTAHAVDLPAPATLVFEKGNYHLYDLAP